MYSTYSERYPVLSQQEPRLMTRPPGPGQEVTIRIKYRVEGQSFLVSPKNVNQSLYYTWIRGTRH